MLHSGGYIGSYAGRNGVGVERGRPGACIGRYPSSRCISMANLSSGFSVPSSTINRLPVANVSTYGPPLPSHHGMVMMKQGGLPRSSPTSVTASMFFDDGRLATNGPPPYHHYHDAYIMNSSVAMPVSYHSNGGLPLGPSGSYPVLNGRAYQGVIDSRDGVVHPIEVRRPYKSPIKPTDDSMPTQAQPRNPKSTKASKSNPRSGSKGGGRGNGRRSGNRSGNSRPGIAAGDGGERPSGSHQQPTPQNLRDNPERLAKVKTEMCHYYEKGGVENCPYGANCNYAHGKHELKFCYTTLSLMESSGKIVNAMTYLARPCMTWVSTGACPFGRRCTGIHDPSISGPLEFPSWLPAATAKTNAQIIVDRLGAHRDNVVHQENPLIAQGIWENCRPSQHGHVKKRITSGASAGQSAHKSILDLEQEWNDTYDLVCNTGVSAFTGGVSHAKSIPEKLSELQKLCIAYIMHVSDDTLEPDDAGLSQFHRDFVFSPTHSLHSELCMVLQTRYFLLADDVNRTEDGNVSPRDIVKEITFEEYESRTTPWTLGVRRFEPRKYVTAHEVAFAPKGDHNSNVSIWFDVSPVKLEQSQIKRSRRIKQKKKTQIHNEHTRPNSNGALISRTSSVDFPDGPPAIDPFVYMLPAEENDASHELLMATMGHRIESIILESFSSGNDEQKRTLFKRMKQLQKTFLSMAKFQEKWTWPKREGMGHVTVTTKAPPGNIMPYIPLKTNKKSPCTHIWHNFVKSLGNLDDLVEHSSANNNTNSKRLSTFLSIDGTLPRRTNSATTDLPHINPWVDDWWNIKTNSPQDDTWKEILLGLPADGKWEAALRLHNKKREESIDDTINTSRNVPLSTIPFVQG